MRKNTLSTVFPLAAAVVAAGLLLAPISCESSGPTTVRGGGGPAVESRPRPGTSDGGGSVPTETPVGYPGPRPTPTRMPSDIPPTPGR